LLDGAKPGEEIFVLHRRRDGLTQVASLPSARTLTDLGSLSIVAYGAPGAIRFGTTVDEADLSDHAPSLASIGASLAAHGDLLMFACNVAAREKGRRFLCSRYHPAVSHPYGAARKQNSRAL
jgi:hypothetical protein